MCRLFFAVCCALALVGLGCSSAQPGAPQVAKIKGTVYIDSKPVPVGEIQFGVVGVPPRMLEIKDGAFAGEAPVGKNQVEVFIYVEGPPTEKYGGIRSKTNVTPQKYWGPNTVLSATVGAKEANDFKFDITSR